MSKSGLHSPHLRKQRAVTVKKARFKINKNMEQSWS